MAAKQPVADAPLKKRPTSFKDELLAMAGAPKEMSKPKAKAKGKQETSDEKFARTAALLRARLQMHKKRLTKTKRLDTLPTQVGYKARPRRA